MKQLSTISATTVGGRSRPILESSAQHDNRISAGVIAWDDPQGKVAFNRPHRKSPFCGPAYN